MKLLFDFLPGVLFLIALFLYDIYTATAVIIVAMVLQVGTMLAMRKPVSGMQWFTLGVVVVFGGATLISHDPLFLLFKPTVINWLFAALLLAGPVVFKKNFVRVLMGEHMTAPDRVWSQLNLAWAAFLALLGVLNLAVVFNTATTTPLGAMSSLFCTSTCLFTERSWGLFKVFGLTGLVVAFSIGQAVVLSRYMNAEAATGPGPREP